MPLLSCKKGQLRDEAARSLYRSVLKGELEARNVTKGGLTHFGPEKAERVRGVWWSGGEDYTRESVLTAHYLHEYLSDVWLQRRSAELWFQNRHLRRPVRTNASAPAFEANKRGPSAKKLQAAAAAMIEAVNGGKLTELELRSRKQKELSAIAPNGGRTLLTKARVIALQRLGQRNSNKTLT